MREAGRVAPKLAEWIAKKENHKAMAAAINSALISYRRDREDRRYPVGLPRDSEPESLAHSVLDEDHYAALLESGKRVAKEVGRVVSNVGITLFATSADLLLRDKPGELLVKFSGKIDEHNALDAFLSFQNEEGARQGWEVNNHMLGKLAGKASMKTRIIAEIVTSMDSQAEEDLKSSDEVECHVVSLPICDSPDLAMKIYFEAIGIYNKQNEPVPRAALAYS